MKNIFQAGLHDDLKPFLKAKIKISNEVAVLMAGVGTFYAVFSYILFPRLTAYPVICIIICVGAIVLNYLALYNISRFLLSTSLLLLAWLYQAFLVQPGEDVIVSMMAIELALTVIPWVLIDYREKGLLILSLFACYVLLFSQSAANEFFSLELDSSIFRTGFMDFFSYVFAVGILVSCLLFMQKRNYHHERHNDELLQDIQEKNQAMEQQQQELQKHLAEMKEAQKQEERQNWVTQGIGMVNDLLRKAGDDIYDVLLKNIVRYIGANQGGMFLLKEEGDRRILEMVACYAYERHKVFSKTIEIGQGLVGQCVLEKEPVLLKEVPQDFVHITSGLGEATPTFVAIIPLMHDDDVAGVMEFGFFHELEPYRVEFLMKLGENIASFVISNTLNTKTKELLGQSQEQAEELRAQEEEMRQNMEEMQATQEELERKEREYIARIEELEAKLKEK